MNITTIIIVSDTPNSNGGSAKVAIDSANGLAQRGFRVIFFTNEQLRGSWNSKVELISLNQYDILSNPNRLKAIIQGLYNIQAKKRFSELLKTLSSDQTVIHFHGWTKGLSSSLFRETAKRKFRVVITLHDYFSFCPNGGFFNYASNEICTIRPMSSKCISKNCDSRNYTHKIWRIVRQIIQKNNIQKNKSITYISISNLNKEIATKHFKEDTRIVHLDNPIDLTKNTNNRIFLSNEERDSYLFLGRISSEKGISLFCEAFSQLKLPAIVIGDGEKLNWYKEKYKEINFVGWKNKKEMIPYIEKSKALIFSSLCYEGSPLTTKEMLSHGIPLIVADKSAAKEDVIEGINGFTFESGNISSLIEKITLFESQDWSKLSKASIKNFNYKKYTLDNHIDKLLNLYNTL